MRILLLTHYYSPEIGAPQRRWRELVTGMLAAGHHVAVCAPVPHYPHRCASDLDSANEKTMVWAHGPHGERLLRLPYLPTSASMAGQLIDHSWSSLFAMRVAAALRAAKPDVVISTTPGLPMLFTGDIAARLLGVPHIAEIRDAWPDLIADSSLVRTATRRLLPAALTDYAERTVIPAAFHAVMRRASQIVVTSDVFASRLRAAGHKAVTVVRNTATPFRPTAQRRERDASSPLRLLYVGTVGRSQGLESLVRAVRELDGIELTIAGAGAAHRSLQRCAESSRSTSGERSDGAAIRVLPQTTGEELERLWKWADSGVVSLRGLPAFEYTVPSKLYTLMARGIHITGILAGEAADIVTDAQAGHVVPPDDESGLRELLTAMRDGRIDLTPSNRAQEWLAQHAAPDVALCRYLSILEGAR